MSPNGFHWEGFFRALQNDLSITVTSLIFLADIDGDKKVVPLPR